MKRALLIVMAIMSSVSVFADEKSDALLAALQTKVAAWGDYRVEFMVTIDGQSLKGSYDVNGDSYHVTTPDIEIYCDGRTKWEVNLLDREVSIDRVNPGDRTVLGNPTKLFDFLDGIYTRRYVGAALINGIECERIELKESATFSTGSGSGQTIDVFLSTATGLPVRIGYSIGFMSAEATVDVVRITPHITLDPTFKYDTTRYSGFEIIDFR